MLERAVQALTSTGTLPGSYDLITVVYKNEVAMLPVQARSIVQYCTDTPQTIYIVVNDLDFVADYINPAWWEHHNVEIITRDQLGVPDYGEGWDSQQLCKLVCGMHSTSKYTVVLDAKTWFIKPFSYTTFITPQVNVGLQTIQPVFQECWDWLCEYFDIDSQQQPGPAGVPYIFETQMLHNLKDYIESREQRSFVDWYCEHSLYPHLITEFLLYASFVYYTNQYKHYTTTNNWKPINIARGEHTVFEDKIQQMQHPDTLTVSIHRDVFDNLSGEQLLAWQQLLQTKMLIDW